MRLCMTKYHNHVKFIKIYIYQIKRLKIKKNLDEAKELCDIHMSQY